MMEDGRCCMIEYFRASDDEKATFPVMTLSYPGTGRVFVAIVNAIRESYDAPRGSAVGCPASFICRACAPFCTVGSAPFV